MKASILRSVAAAIVLAAPAALPAEDDDAVRRAVAAANAIVDQASKDGDWPTLATYYADDVLVLPNHEPMIRGRAAFLENEQKWRRKGLRILEIDTTVTDFFVTTELVHEVGTYEVVVLVPGLQDPVTDTGKYLVIWQRGGDGSLRIKLEVWNNDTEPRD